MIYIQIGTSDYQVILTYEIGEEMQKILWLACFIAFAIKIPMIPFHIWLPEAHVEAPTAASVILAAILLKLGSYGFLRFSLPLFPLASSYFTPLVYTISIIGIIYSSFACLAQWDLKKIIAYSSIGHMNTATIGIFTNDFHGLSASFYFLLSHAFISSALFLLIGVLYDRYHTRTIKYYRGLVFIMPLFTFFLFIFTLANIALPGTSGFISEFLTFVGTFNSNPFVAFWATFAILLAPTYSLLLLHKVSYGSFSNHISTLYQDITLKEFHTILPLFILTFFFGLFPNLIFDSTQFSFLALLQH